MRRLVWIPLLLVALIMPVVVMAAGGSENRFGAVVAAIGGRYHAHATRIPMMGLISFVARLATHGGVSAMRVAEFEHFDQNVDGEELCRMVEQKLGAGWERMVRDTSRDGREQSLIYVHPEGKRMGMLVVDLDGSEMNVVQLFVDPDHLNDTIQRYEKKDRGEQLSD